MLRGLIGSLVGYGICAGAEHLIHVHEVGMVAHVVAGAEQMVQSAWIHQLAQDLDTLADFFLAGFALMVVDFLVSDGLSMRAALADKTQPDVLRGAVAVGWCALAAAFVVAFS